MKIYTRTGDAGQTSLFGGRRVGKDNPRVQAYGAVDELNAVLGLAIAHLGQEEPAALLRRLQDDLFQIGADLATPDDPNRPAGSQPARVGDDRVEELERAIDRYDADLPPLRQFILPGGTVAGATLHLARTVARRAERCAVALAAREPVNPAVLRYLNRLSDLLFVLARWVNHRAGVADIPWGSPPWRGPAREPGSGAAAEGDGTGRGSAR
ncbi:MAG TPA: cob(I)yrinic acid a,c-diamide adenosyltransferase [Thermaerobacter sp.]